MDGTDGEAYIENLFKNNNLFLNHNGIYAPIDYTFITDKYKILLELKTRSVSIDTFASTFFAVNKIDYYRRIKKDKTKTNILYLIFGFKSTTYNAIDENLEYYYCVYNTAYFKGLQQKTNNYEAKDKQYYMIPVSYLKPIDELINKLRHISQ